MNKLIIKVCTEKAEYEEGIRNIKNAGFFKTAQVDNHEFWNSNRHEVTYEVVREF